MKTVAARLMFIRYGLPLAAAIVGFAIGGGGLSVVLALAVAVIIPLSSRMFRKRRELREEYLKAKSIHLASARPAGVMIAALVILSLLFVLYSISIISKHDSHAVADWMKAFQPAVDWLSPVIPALQRMPSDLIKRGQAEWAPVVQHILLVGWMFFFVSAAWIALDVLIISRRLWGQARPVLNFRGWTVLALMSVFIIAILTPIFFFGLSPKSGRYAGAENALFVLIMSFPIIVYFFFALVGSCNALLLSSRFAGKHLRDEPIVIAQPLLMDILRRSLNEGIFGRLFRGKSEGHE